MSGLGVRKRLIMAHKITGSVAYEWKCAGEPCFTVVSSLFLKASSPEKRERNKPIRAVLYGCGRCRQSRSHHVWFLGSSVYPVFQNTLSPSWKMAKDTLLFITRILSAHSQLLGALTCFLACFFCWTVGTNAVLCTATVPGVCAYTCSGSRNSDGLMVMFWLWFNDI